jgi:hypothetical protein
LFYTAVPGDEYPLDGAHRRHVQCLRLAGQIVLTVSMLLITARMGGFLRVFYALLAAWRPILVPWHQSQTPAANLKPPARIGLLKLIKYESTTASFAGLDAGWII